MADKSITTTPQKRSKLDKFQLFFEYSLDTTKTAKK